MSEPKMAPLSLTNLKDAFSHTKVASLGPSKFLEELERWLDVVSENEEGKDKTRRG